MEGKMGVGVMGVMALSMMLAGTARASSLQQAQDPGNGNSKGLASDSAEALIRGDDTRALQLADQAVAADDHNPWAHYDRAVALGNLRRVDEAVGEYDAAQARFSSADTWGRSVAIYGRAHLLADNSRCVEAKAAFGEYITFVGASDPQGVAQAQRGSDTCRVAGT
jgi:hypothetical protein